MIRLHYVHDEACYVVRRPNGIPLSVPAWMTEPGAAEIRIVAVPLLPLDMLVELRRLASIHLSLVASPAPKGERDAATPVGTKNSVRRRPSVCVPVVTAGGSSRGDAATGAVDAIGGASDKSGDRR